LEEDGLEEETSFSARRLYCRIRTPLTSVKVFRGIVHAKCGTLSENLQELESDLMSRY